MPRTNLERIESVFKIIAVVIAALWTFYLFEYENVILPKREPIALSVKVDSKKMGEINGLTFIKLSIVFKNDSKIKEKIVSAYLNTCGYKIAGSGKDSSFGDYATMVENNDLKEDNFSNYRKVQPNSLQYFHFSRLLSDNFPLAPGEEQTAYTVIAFPTKKFDMVHTEIVLTQSKADAPVLVKWEKDSSQQISSYVMRVDGKDTIPLDLSDTHPKPFQFLKKYNIFSINYPNDYFTNATTDIPR